METTHRALLGRIRAICRLYARAMATLAILVGLSVLFGWWFDVERLTSLGPNLHPVVANTALMSTLAGTSLLLSTSNGAKRARSFEKLCAAAVFALAGTTLIEYGLGDLGID